MVKKMNSKNMMRQGCMVCLAAGLFFLPPPQSRAEPTRVLKAGDTMTGTLTLNAATALTTTNQPGLSVSTNLFVTAGSVGIGTASPGDILHVRKSGGMAILDSGVAAGQFNLNFRDNNVDKWGIFKTIDNKLGFWNYNTGYTGLKLILDTQGNVGIGTATPTNILDILQDSNAVNRIRITNPNSGTGARAGLLLEGADSSNTASLDLFGSGNTAIAGWQDSFVFGSNSGLSGGVHIRAAMGGIHFEGATPGTPGELMGITASGNVGISTGAPAARLDVLAGGSTPADMAQLWRNSAGTIVSSVSATGVIMASKFVGDGSGISGLSGTLNGGQTPRLPYWTGAATLGNSNLSRDSAASLTAMGSTFTVQGGAFSVGGSTLVVADGKVGLGTASPSFRLQLGNNTSVALATPETISLGGTHSSVPGGNAKLRLWTNGTVTMGLGVSGSQLDYIVDQTTYDHVFYAAPNELMRIKGTGNVGIGASPVQKLHVQGAVGNPALSGTTQNGIMRLSNASDTAVLDIGMRAVGAGAWLQSADKTSLGASYSLSLNPNGGYVAIGTGTPSYPLHVYNAANGGMIAVDGPTAQTKQYRWLNNNALQWAAYTPANGNDLLFYDTAVRVAFKSGGNVGIGTTAPGTLLNVNGHALIGGITPPFGDASVLNVVASDQGAMYVVDPPVSSLSGRGLAIAATGDTYSRILLYSNGFAGFGPGNADKDVFLGRSAANTLRIGGAYNGTGTGNLIVNGMVGISTGAPAARLDVLAGGATPADMAQLWRNSAGTIVSSVSATGVIMASKFIGDGSGISGLSGTLSGGSAPLLPYWTSASTLGNSNLSRDSAASLTAVNSTFTVQGSAFSVGGSTFVVMAGKVGLGTASPSFRLQLGDNTPVATATPETISLGGTYSSAAGANAKLRLWTEGTDVIGMGVSANQLDYVVHEPAADHVFYSGANELMRIKGTGNVGIGGAASPSAKLEVLGDVKASDIYIKKFTLPSDGNWYAVAAAGGRWGRIAYTYEVPTPGAPVLSSGEIMVINDNFALRMRHKTTQYTSNNNLQFARSGNSTESGVIWVKASGGTNGTFYVTENQSCTIYLDGTNAATPPTGVGQVIYPQLAGDADIFSHKVLISGNVGISTGAPAARLDVLAGGATPADMAQLWRNSAGTIVSSVSATGVIMASKFIGDGSGLSGISGGSSGPSIDVSTINAPATTPYGGVNITTNVFVNGTARIAKFEVRAADTGITLTAADFGKTITVNSASAQVVYLPAVDASNIGATFRIVKLGAGRVTVDAADSDTINNSGAGDTIYNNAVVPPYASVDLLLVTDTGWAIVGGQGAWITTD
ncbi:MAG TPA: hypothetical protein DCZ93_02880 [Elusimicrobia bacterium]|nr:hypothetical protein [Elusimicrobiota bacterium]